MYLHKTIELERKLMVPCISIIICTHNPRVDYLNRVIGALREQTLELDRWELLLIDNASNQQLDSEFDLSWHPQSRHIREEQLGLTFARARGIQEARAKTLIFVDDDNVLDQNYLAVTLDIGDRFPFIGAWGGQIKGEFEVPPPDWAKPYLPLLAIREFEQDKWSNLLYQHETTPCGAGLCIRKEIAERYCDLTRNNPQRINLDRKGNLLTSCGDSDLAFMACDLGFGTGQFTALKLTHLMPVGRLEESYLVRLVEGMTYSNTILDSLRGRFPTPLQPSLKTKLRELYEFLTTSSMEKRFQKAKKRGMQTAFQEITIALTNTH
jgi:glycosyltransferase involved in cell wall biosynthesis